jgi:hypothetical protein
MFENLELSQDERQVLDEVYDDLQKYFELKADQDFELDFKDYFMCKTYQDIELGEALQIAEGSNNAFITFTRVSFYRVYTRTRRTYLYSEWQVYAVARLPKDFGHVFIRKETLRDKIVEFFEPLEMDIKEDKEFNKKYYVLAKEKDKAEKLFTAQFRDELNKLLLQDFCIEVLKDTLVIANKKTPQKTETLSLASFVYNVSDLKF